MRSRYCAFSLCIPLYIIKTTHPLNNDFTENKDLWKKEILHFSKEFTFEKLTILEFLKPTKHTQSSYVTFTAKLTHNNTDHSFTEKSKFEKINENWYYLSGEQL